MNNFIISRALSFALVLSIQITLRAQGPLVPPGPPGLTFRTLQQVEPRTPISSLPFTIARPGSYYMTTNLAGGAGNGIIISNSDVSLDLNGFTLGGGTGNGIVTPVTCSNVWVRNGTVRDWSFHGLSNGLAVASGAENVRVMNNGRDGIVFGASAVVQTCMVIACGDRGINVGSDRKSHQWGGDLHHELARMPGRGKHPVRQLCGPARGAQQPRLDSPQQRLIQHQRQLRFGNRKQLGTPGQCQ